MTARLVSVYRYFGKLILVPFRYFSIDTYRNIDIFDNTSLYLIILLMLLIIITTKIVKTCVKKTSTS